MSDDALSQVTLALQKHLHTALGGMGQPDDSIFIGPPIGPALTRPVSLFLFHIEPNRELRNQPRLVAGGGSDPDEKNSLALDLRYLISVFRQAGASATSPNELLALGQIIAGLQADPTIGQGVVPGQEMRLTPEPYPMEELSRIWGLFPNASYATSIVYLASPVYIDANSFTRGHPVVSRRLDGGLSADAPDVFGKAASAIGQGYRP